MDAGDDKVDPAALLIAVIAGAGTPLTQSGAWYPINSVIGLVILGVLCAYALTANRRTRERTWTAGLAIGGVIGLICVLLLGYPLQSLVSGTWTPPAAETDPTIEKSTWIGVAIGAVVMVAIALWLGHESTSARPQPSERRHPEPALATELERLNAVLELLRSELAVRQASERIDDEVDAPSPNPPADARHGLADPPASG